MTTIVFPDPESAVTFQEQLAAGVAILVAAREAAADDIPVALGLRTTALDGRTVALAQQAAVAAFVPGATYRAADLVAVRDQMVAILDRQAAILQALAGIYAYRAAVDQNAVLTDNALLRIARLASGLLDYTQETPL